MNYDKLIEQLNAWNERHLSVVCGGKHFACDYLCENEDCIVVRAASAIETLRADLARVTAERDAAISDLTCIARTYPVELCDDLVCQYCKHYPNINAGCPGWTDDDCFEWRGIEED